MFVHDSDHVGSDDMEAVLLSLSQQDSGPSNSALTRNGVLAAGSSESSYLRKQNLNTRLSRNEAEMRGLDEEIKKLKAARLTLVQENEQIHRELQAVQNGRPLNGVDKGKGRAVEGSIDYNGEFDWDHVLTAKMKKVFNITQFRLCQRGVCNANMDGRDIVCVMPTGGGKSLTYQLPALLASGCTMVISPLISLMTDQILHLREAGGEIVVFMCGSDSTTTNFLHTVEAVMLTGGTSKEEVRDVMQRLSSVAQGTFDARRNKEIKLCYVTPEKIAKSKSFTALMEKLANANKLARIVIDEAHCVSQLGHDFRPDYKKLNVLRKLVPRVPILALSATCPPRVLQDLLKILQMKTTTNGNSAQTDGTVYFSAPLYRKNLHYAVVPKPSSGIETIRTMTSYILTHHKDDSGIVYCLNRKDTETVAKELLETSEGKIKTGVYHAGVRDGEKERLHKQWRKGDIKVVCATIAFGMGIDKANVRFVLHHSISKSMDGFYQESGRAGRDGEDADCILYYRPQDASRLTSLTYQEAEAGQKLHDILRFSQNLRECRKVLFAQYFSASSHLSMSSWTTDDSDALARCGHCDNCTRAPESFDHKDVTVEAWQIIKIVDAVEKEGGRITLGKLADLARGTGGGTFDIVGGGGGGKRKRQSKDKAILDVDAIAEGKIGLSKDDAETLIVELLLSGFLEESFSSTAYTVNVYVKLGRKAARLTSMSRDKAAGGYGPKIECSFRKPTRKTRAGGKSRVSENKASGSTKKRKEVLVQGIEKSDDGDDENEGDDDGFVVDDDVVEVEDFSARQRVVDVTDSEPDEEARSNSWEFSFRPSKKPRIPYGEHNEVVVLSSD